MDVGALRPVATTAGSMPGAVARPEGAEDREPGRDGTGAALLPGGAD